MFKSKVTTLGKYAENLGKFDEICHYIILNIIIGSFKDNENASLKKSADSKAGITKIEWR